MLTRRQTCSRSPRAQVTEHAGLRCGTHELGQQETRAPLLRRTAEVSTHTVIHAQSTTVSTDARLTGQSSHRKRAQAMEARGAACTAGGDV